MPESTLGIGLYSLVEAARLLKTPRRTLSRWVEGYARELRDGVKTYKPLIAHDDEAALSFADLVELLYVRGFRDAGVDLDVIRRTAAKYRRDWQTPFPLATRRFATDGKGLLLKEGEGWKHAMTGQIQAFMDEMAKQLVHTGNLASEWRPLGIQRHVVLDPERAFGKPIDDVSGAHTFLLAQAIESGATTKELAWWYDTTEQSIVDAVEFERLWSPRKQPRIAAA
ncbi:MAG TPA: hypothetical protein VHE55_01630 [Fimbriimonadaceae bacterium]|nr:hypothetical protein [Fimbriimonadaceae bacterium]